MITSIAIARIAKFKQYDSISLCRILGKGISLRTNLNTLESSIVSPPSSSSFGIVVRNRDSKIDVITSFYIFPFLFIMLIF